MTDLINVNNEVYPHLQIRFALYTSRMQLSAIDLSNFRSSSPVLVTIICFEQCLHCSFQLQQQSTDLDVYNGSKLLKMAANLGNGVHISGYLLDYQSIGRFVLAPHEWTGVRKCRQTTLGGVEVHRTRGHG